MEACQAKALDHSSRYFGLTFNPGPADLFFGPAEDEEAGEVLQSPTEFGTRGKHCIAAEKHRKKKGNSRA